MKTSDEYKSTGGLYCPNCEENSVELGDKLSDIVEEAIYYPCSCNNCGVQWDEVYTLAGYDEDSLTVTKFN